MITIDHDIGAGCTVADNSINSALRVVDLGHADRAGEMECCQIIEHLLHRHIFAGKQVQHLEIDQALGYLIHQKFIILCDLRIGVTTTQQMLESERESRKYSTVYEIIGEFKERFCLLVY